MDLIYADENRKDIDVLKDYTLDIAYGSDENDFELEVDLNNHCCQKGYYIYIENSIDGRICGTEYGGVIDNIKVDTEKKLVTYSGRSWQGILATKVIEPPKGYDYLCMNGDANKCIKQVISGIGLSDIFTVSTKDSPVEIVNYNIRYKNVYHGLCKMLSEFDGKLLLRYEEGKVVLSAEYLMDYSQEEEWDSSQVAFTIEKKYRPVNHLICMGQGDLKDRHVIHLFTDEYGGIQPYSRVDNPVKDSDYILDKSMQVMTGIDEVVEVYDYPNAQVTENYVRLYSQPADWAAKYGDYYKLDEKDSYTNLEASKQETYSLLASQPGNWSAGYTDYFEKDSTGYKAVEGDVTTSYRKQTAQPADWTKNYANYYYYWSDGVASEYKAVDGVQKTRYNMQTQKPTDWEKNYSQYYQKKKKGGYTAVSGVKKGKKTVAPAWKARRYYTSENYSVAPKWSAKYYTLSETTSAPAWTANKYYSVSTVTVKPPFVPGAVYKKEYDYFAEMVESGIEKLKESSLECDSITIDLDLTGNYDIGDIVGALENKTGIAVWQPITKKIVTIKNGKESISYEIGKEA